jgi:hypothetical protein
MSLDLAEVLQVEINRVAEVHFYVKPVLNRALQAHTITSAGKMMIGEYDSMYEYWQARHGDKWFDMSTVIRLGTAIENNLKRYYMEKKGHATLADLRHDPRFDKGIFQRVQSWQTNGVLQLYNEELSFDLRSNPHLPSAQELMMHRHLYAHNSGLLDDEYIDRIQTITGQDMVKSWSFCNFLQARFLLYRSMSIAPSSARSSRWRSSCSRMSR